MMILGLAFEMTMAPWLNIVDWMGVPTSWSGSLGAVCAAKFLLLEGGLASIHVLKVNAMGHKAALHCCTTDTVTVVGLHSSTPPVVVEMDQGTCDLPNCFMTLWLNCFTLVWHGWPSHWCKKTMLQRPITMIYLTLSLFPPWRHGGSIWRGIFFLRFFYCTLLLQPLNS